MLRNLSVPIPIRPNRAGIKDKFKAERFSLRFKNLTVLFFIRARPDGKIGDRLASDRDYSGGSLFSVPSWNPNTTTTVIWTLLFWCRHAAEMFPTKGILS